MFPELTTRRPNKRSLRELVRGAVGTALEFATLGEATLDSAVRRTGSPAGPARSARPAAPTAAHPHRRRLTRQPPARRGGTVRPRAQVCRTPVHRPAPGGPDRPKAPGLGGRERRTAWRPPRGAGLHRLSGRPSPGGPSAFSDRDRGHSGHALPRLHEPAHERARVDLGARADLAAGQQPRPGAHPAPLPQDRSPGAHAGRMAAPSCRRSSSRTRAPTRTPSSTIVSLVRKASTPTSTPAPMRASLPSATPRLSTVRGPTEVRSRTCAPSPTTTPSARRASAITMAPAPTTTASPSVTGPAAGRPAERDPRTGDRPMTLPASISQPRPIRAAGAITAYGPTTQRGAEPGARADPGVRHDDAAGSEHHSVSDVGRIRDRGAVAGVRCALHRPTSCHQLADRCSVDPCSSSSARSKWAA